MRIQVICGAGASSTFVAARLRRAAQAAGADWQVTASPLDSVDVFADVLLLGSHIADHRAELSRRAPRARIIVLPEDVFADLDGARVHTIVRAGIADTTASRGTP